LRNAKIIITFDRFDINKSFIDSLKEIYKLLA